MPLLHELIQCWWSDLHIVSFTFQQDDICVHHTCKGGVYVGHIEPLALKVPHKASACVTFALYAVMVMRETPSLIHPY